MSVSTRVADSNALYFGRTAAKWSRILMRRSGSRLRRVLGALEHRDERLGGVVARAERHRRDRRVDDVGAGLDRLHEADQRDARGRMAVDVDLHVAVRVLDALDDVVRGLRLEQRGHVLERDGLGAHVEQLAGELDVALGGVQRAHRVADRALGVLAGLLDGRHRLSHVPRVVEGVEHPEDVHAVLGGLLDELVDDHVLVVAVAEEVLPSQQHLKPRVRHELAEGPQALPRILVQVADAGVVRRPAPTLHTPVASLVDILASTDHVLHRHTDGDEALVGVAEHDLGHTDRSRHASIPPGCPISGHTPWGLPEPESGHDRRRVDQNAVRDVLDEAPPWLPQRAIRHHPVVHAHAEVDAERDDEQDTGGRTKADDAAPTVGQGAPRTGAIEREDQARTARRGCRLRNRRVAL